MKLGLGGANWGGQREHENRDAQYDQNDMKDLKSLQFTVASSTFSAIAFMGLFCTCLWLGCCRHKRHSRIQGRTWNTNSSLAGPIERGTMGLNPYDQSLNPYMINTGYYTDLNLNTAGGLYHPSAGLQKDEKPPADSTYKPFFAQMEWEPPQPPAYHSLGFENPAYAASAAIAASLVAAQKQEDLIKEKVPTSILATSDPTKLHHSDNPLQSEGLSKSAQSTSNAEDEQGIDANEKYVKEGASGANDSSSAPDESIVSIESKDTGYAFSSEYKAPEQNQSSSPSQGIEELKPPPYNPSYLRFTNQFT